MDGFTRYALYFAPPPGPLADFGAAWLGWDPRAGRRVAHIPMSGLPLPVSEITAAPRKYGFHATLKPPFRLAAQFDVGELHNAAEALASSLAPVLLDGLRVTGIGEFLALTPVGDQTRLALLTARVVEALDIFRAPPDEAELRRRRDAGLSARQEELLKAWGYPHVMEEFRFHLTLTGRLPPQTRDTVKARLDEMLEPLLPRPFRMREMSLFGEGQDGRFHLLNSYILSG
ncbi:DUF1045 domain-containing protein [Tropicimonas sp.]|uniref:DUF1045 domain-containing protein n=1 Tax=Tropicimonas sp. TaxID=2067044 RepID=UPI003A88A34C